MPITYESVAAQLNEARTRAQLLAAGERIQHVEGFTDQNRLGAIFKRRLDEIKSTTRR